MADLVGHVDVNLLTKTAKTPKCRVPVRTVCGAFSKGVRKPRPLHQIDAHNLVCGTEDIDMHVPEALLAYWHDVVVHVSWTRTSLLFRVGCPRSGHHGGHDLQPIEDEEIGADYFP